MLHPLAHVRDHQNPLADTPALASCQAPQLGRPRFAAKKVCRHTPSPKHGTLAHQLYHIWGSPEAGITLSKLDSIICGRALSTFQPAPSENRERETRARQLHRHERLEQLFAVSKPEFSGRSGGCSRLEFIARRRMSGKDRTSPFRGEGGKVCNRRDL